MDDDKLKQLKNWVNDGINLFSSEKEKIYLSKEMKRHCEIAITVYKGVLDKIKEIET